MPGEIGACSAADSYNTYDRYILPTYCVFAVGCRSTVSEAVVRSVQS
jgi:hypothetical protein